MKVLGKMQKWVRNGVILKVGIFHVFGFFSFMEPSRKTKLVSYYKLMVGYLHVEAVGPTRGQRILMGLQSRFLKTARKWPFLSRISTKSQNFTTCKFVGHSPTLAVPAKIMLDHPEKCQEQKCVFFRNPYLAPIWPLWTPLKWSLGGRNPWKLPTPKFYGKWTITSCRINIFGRWGREAYSQIFSFLQQLTLKHPLRPPLGMLKA